MGAFNGSGVFVRSYNWTQDAANAIDITASRVDTEDTGFASGLSLCVTRDGQGPMASNFLPAATDVYSLGSGSIRWTGINGALSFASTGAIQVNTPVSGVPLTVLAAEASVGMSLAVINAVNGVSFAFNDITGGQNRGFIGFGAQVVGGAALSDFALSPGVGGRLVIGKANGTAISHNFDGLGNFLGRGAALCKTKTADTNRNTTVTTAADPDLTYAVPAAGTYQVEATLIFDSANAAAGFKYTYGFTGTQTLNVGFETGFVNAGIVGPTNINNLTAGARSYGTVSTTANSNYVILTGTFLITVAGTLSINWAQSSSSATNSTLRAGSWLKVTQTS